MVAATAGNTPPAYSADGANLFSPAELVRPLQAMAYRCGLEWKVPFLLYEARSVTEGGLAEAGRAYAGRLRGLGGIG